jgi:NAD-dependent SIR2 family protein deacetylase
MCNFCELTYRRNGQLVHHADVEEVRHGKWVKTNSRLAEMTCSLCGFTYYGEHDEECMSNFCPECGAKMDGERREE